jgi:uncharacterized membrane protein
LEKITISVTERQSDYLESEEVRLGIVGAEIVRRALDYYIDHFPYAKSDDNKETQLPLLKQ